MISFKIAYEFTLSEIFIFPQQFELLSHVLLFHLARLPQVFLAVEVSVSSITQLCPTLCSPWTTAFQTSLSITNSQSLLKLMSIDLGYHSTISSSVIPFSYPSAFNHFQYQGLFQWVSDASGGQSIGVSASASVLPMNIQDWFPLGLTNWISLQSKGLSRVLSNNTIQNHPFFSAQPSL